MALVLILAGSPSQAQAASGSNRWFHPIPVPASAASSPPLRRALQRWNQQQLSNARECGRDLQESRPEIKFSKNSELPYTNQYQVMFDSPTLYSVAVATELDCGGPYPVLMHKVVSWEVESGRDFDPLTLYRIGTRQEYGISVLPEIRPMIRQQLIRKARSESKGSDCRKILRQDKLNSLEPDSIGLTKSGLYLAMDGVHATAFCYVPVFLDHQQIRKYLQPEVADRIRWPLQ